MGRGATFYKERGDLLTFVLSSLVPSGGEGKGSARFYNSFQDSIVKMERGPFMPRFSS
jgi:hypothetical protein